MGFRVVIKFNLNQFFFCRRKQDSRSKSADQDIQLLDVFGESGNDIYRRKNIFPSFNGLNKIKIEGAVNYFQIVLIFYSDEVSR